MKRLIPVLVVAALALGLPPTARPADGPTVVTLDSPSPLLQIRLMVKTGSAHDPAGKEGLAGLTAQALLQGGYGDPADPVTKEMLAERTLPWGDDARPDVLVDKQATTFSFTVPRNVLDEYVESIFEPLLARPVFAEAEIARLVEEAETSLNQLR
ncbi:MAG: insulinase family protein, partial [Acidobacteriota bacterium]